MSDQNKSLVRRFMDEIWNKKNTAKLEDFLTPQCSVHTSDGTVRGLNEYRQFHENYTRAFPDCKFTVEDIVAEGDLVSARCTLTGTHKGDLRGIHATNKQIREEVISIMRFSGGKVNDVNVIWDRLSLMEQLGLTPEQMKQAASRAAVG